jgi:hypothetical protein
MVKCPCASSYGVLQLHAFLLSCPNTLDSYSGGARFECWPGHWLRLPAIPQSPEQNCREIPPLGHNRFLPYLSKSILTSSYQRMLYSPAIGSVVKTRTQKINTFLTSVFDGCGWLGQLPFPVALLQKYPLLWTGGKKSPQPVEARHLRWTRSFYLDLKLFSNGCLRLNSNVVYALW